MLNKYTEREEPNHRCHRQQHNLLLGQFAKQGVSDFRITFSGFSTANHQNQNSKNITILDS